MKRILGMEEFRSMFTMEGIFYDLLDINKGDFESLDILVTKFDRIVNIIETSDDGLKCDLEKHYEEMYSKLSPISIDMCDNKLERILNLHKAVSSDTTMINKLLILYRDALECVFISDKYEEMIELISANMDNNDFYEELRQIFEFETIDECLNAIREVTSKIELLSIA